MCVCWQDSFGESLSETVAVHRSISSPFFSFVCICVRACVCVCVRTLEKDTDPVYRILDLAVWNLVNSSS